MTCFNKDRDSLIESSLLFFFFFFLWGGGGGLGHGAEGGLQSVLT